MVLYGDERNPVKYGLGEEPLVGFEETAVNRRTVVVEEKAIPPIKRGELTVEFAKITTDHPIELKALPVKAR